MKRLSRRTFVAAAAGAMAWPRLAGIASAGEVDIAIVGAGAAGIAAGRRIAAAGRRVAIFEAAESVGGRCITDTGTFGAPFDLGAHWIHSPDSNPVAKLAARTGLDVYAAPPGQKLRIGRRNAREGELEVFLSSVVRSRRAFEEAARGKVDTSCLHVLPRDLGDWRPTVEFFLGPFGLSKDLSEISVVDVSRLGERETAAFCRQGFGALLARLAEGLPVELATPVTRIDSSRTLEIQTTKGRIAARAVIVTASSSVLASGKIQFAPDLPKRQLDAFNRLRLGSYDRIALELPGNRLGLQRDDLVFEKADGPRTAALLANVSGSNLVYVDVAGSFGRELAAKGKGEMTAFALDWLDKLFGADARKAVKRSHVTQWNSAPYALGASSAATVGQQLSRRIMMEPLRERIFFAGEAVHETLWGSVGGAWESGERAADAALRLFGIGVKPQPAQPQRPQRSKR